MSSLTQIQFPANTPQGFTEWTYQHYVAHQAIIDAALKVKNVQLIQYQIWPVNIDDIDGFLENHQNMHNQMNQLYGVYGNDLSTLDWKDRRAVDAFYFLNWQEHVAVASRCGLPI